MASGPDSKPIYVPQRFVAWRQPLFPTQAALAKRLDCTPSLISRYETGKSTPSKFFLKLLKKEFPELDPDARFFRRNGRP